MIQNDDFMTSGGFLGLDLCGGSLQEAIPRSH